MAKASNDLWTGVVAATRARWAQALAYLTPRCQRLATGATDVLRQAVTRLDGGGGRGDARHVRPQAAPGPDGSRVARHRADSDVGPAEDGEFVPLTDLFEAN